LKHFLNPYSKDEIKPRFRDASSVKCLIGGGSDIHVSFLIMLFQAGFSLNGSNFRPYDTVGKRFLECIDQGYIPPLLTELLESSSPRIQYYDGCLIAEIQDFRLSTKSHPRPEKKHVLLQPGPDYISYGANLV
jgi:hypothetical protein